MSTFKFFGVYNTRTSVYICISTTCIYIYFCIDIYTCLYLCICIYLYIYICIYIYIYVKVKVRVHGRGASPSMAGRRKIAVTGAGGFLGQLARQSCEDRVLQSNMRLSKTWGPCLAVFIMRIIVYFRVCLGAPFHGNLLIKALAHMSQGQNSL